MSGMTSQPTGQSRSLQPLQRRVYRGGLLVVFLGAAILYLASVLGSGRPMEFTLTQEVRTSLPPSTLQRSMEILANWPQWHRGVELAQSLDLRREPYSQMDQILEPGALIRLQFKAQGDGPAPHLIFRVDRYASLYELTLKLLEDSTGSIPAQFEEVGWTLSFPSPDRIRLEVKARPATFKSKLLCLIAKPLVLVNLRIPQIERLAELKQPLGRDSVPMYQR